MPASLLTCVFLLERFKRRNAKKFPKMGAPKSTPDAAFHFLFSAKLQGKKNQAHNNGGSCRIGTFLFWKSPYSLGANNVQYEHFFSTF